MIGVAEDNVCAKVCSNLVEGIIAALWVEILG